MEQRYTLLLSVMVGIVAMSAPTLGQTVGVTDTEIKIGQSFPYSGPLSGYGVLGRQHVAFFKMINDEGGINGRKVNLISLDDGFSPPQAVERTRQLVESDKVAFIFANIGTATNTAIAKYLNGKKIPQLFIGSGADKWKDHKQTPWTISALPSYRSEAAIYARYILAHRPDAKIGILYQNDDFGKDYLLGLKDVLGDRYRSMVVLESSYETTDPTVDSQIISLKGSGANVLVIAALAKAATQAIRKVSDLEWKPLQFLSYTSQSSSVVMVPAGPGAGIGVISANFVKDPGDPAWASDPGLLRWKTFLEKYMPGQPLDPNLVTNYASDFVLAELLKQCGNDLSRENIMKRVTNMKNVSTPVFLPGIAYNTTPTDYRTVTQMQLQQWTGSKWDRLGDVVDVR